MDPGNCIHDLDFLLNGVARATTDIRHENLRLRTENERLEKLLSEIMPELERLRKEQVTLKAAVRVLVLQTGALPLSNRQKQATFATLPHEILQPIFNFAAAEPTYQFDPSIQPGSYSPWLQLIRMKKGFPLICRASFWPGMAVLYSDIVLRRMGQASALAETLRTPDISPRLGILIKSIRWDSCVVAAPCANVIREDLMFIFGQCTQLQSFSYHPHHNFPLRCQPPDNDECEGFFNPLWFIMMPSSLSDPPLLQTSAVSNLRFLDLPVGLDNDAMLLTTHKILSTFRALESLILGPWPSTSPFPEEIMNMPRLSLPSLTDLRIFAPEGAADSYLCSRWDAPQLTRLTILISTGWSPLRLLERLGSRLRYLHLYPIRSVTGLPNVSAYLPTLSFTLSAVCPLLEHLIVPRSAFLIVASPTLAHLDFWTTQTGPKSPQDRSQAEANRLWTVNARSNAPSLRTVRFIFTSASTALGSSNRKSAMCDPDWPWICHPRLLPEGSDDALYHRFPLGCVAQTPAAIIPQDLWERCWKGRHTNEDWPGVYGDLDEMQRIMDAEREESEHRRCEQQEDRGAEETSSSAGWTSDDSDSEEEGDGDEHPKEHGTVTSENAEGTGGSEGLQDGQGVHGDLTGEQSQQVDSEEQAEQEGDVETSRRQLGATVEPVSPEVSPSQLDRATILAAFRRGRDRESYNHIAPWDQF